MENQQQTLSPPPSVIKNYTIDAGVRFGVDPDLFRLWWRGIPLADQEGFKFHGGDVPLARFVCAFDYLSHHARKPRAESLTTSYGAAYGIDPFSHTCRVRAASAFEHPAVVFLLDQFEYRAMRATRERTVPRFSQLLTKILDEALDADTKLEARISAGNAYVRFYKALQTEDINARNLYTKASVKHAMERTNKELDALEDDLTDAEKERHIQDLVRLMGKEKMLALVSGSKEQDVPQSAEVLDLAEGYSEEEPE